MGCATKTAKWTQRADLRLVRMALWQKHRLEKCRLNKALEQVSHYQDISEWYALIDKGVVYWATDAQPSDSQS